MKPFQNFNQSLQDWWRSSHDKWTKEPLSFSLLPPQKTPRCPGILHKICCSRRIRKIHSPVMFGIAVVSLTGVIGYRFYNQPQLSVGSLSPTTITAPKDAQFLDEKTTEDKRKEVRAGIVPRLKRDAKLTQQLEQNRSDLLAQINQLRAISQPFPFIDPKILSLTGQQYLRSCSDEEWQYLLNVLQSRPSSTPPSPELAQISQTLRVKIKTLSPGELNNLIAKVKTARQGYAQVLAQLALIHLEHLSPDIIIEALQLDNGSWKATQQAINQTFNRILIQGLPPGISQNLLEETLQLQLPTSLPAIAQKIAQGILLALLSDNHNLTIDKEETKRYAEQAAQSIEPVVISIKRGEIIVKAGQPIEQRQFVVLDGLGLSQRETNWTGLGISAGLAAGAVLIFSSIAQRVYRPLRRRDHILLCLLSLSVPAMALLHPRYASLPAVGLLVSSFYGPTLAVSQVLLVGGLSTFATNNINWEYTLAGIASGVMAGLIAGRLRSRDDLALLGAGVGGLQGGVYLVTYLILSTTATSIWYAVLPGAVIYGLLGMAWCIVAIGISPYLERFFDVVTPIRLVELANPNCPLLKRLTTEAPGTFQHTLFVACLAEAAARELRCNVELVRTGTLYHDIGKMHDPLGFIENQMGGPNKHDQIQDPYISVEIIKKHVSEGTEMARRYGLPQVVRDFIPEHQGTLLISYFYHQAKELAEKEGTAIADESLFRYDGPIPQSRETGIVMLADSSEAALRSLKNATPEAALIMINRIFKARWRDEQLKDSGLKYEELPIIADVFVRVWQQFHHQRIVYPQTALESPKPIAQTP
ncbi:MAG: HD family phosphohydrolase [Snowella sp.]|nr:HD family phosphohydrolase [Snowella sp.]